MMKLLTYKTLHCARCQPEKNGAPGEIDFDAIADVIRTFDADVVGLNEIRGQGSADAPRADEFQDQLKILAEKTGYPYYYFARAIDVPGGGPYGNGLLSRYPIVEAQIISIADPETRTGPRRYEHRCVLKARLDVPGGFTVLVAHFGVNPDEEECAVQAILSNVEPERCVVMGDFNTTPDSGILQPLQERLYDTAQRFPQPRLSFPSFAPECKIDYIFTTKDCRVLAADVASVVVSDHCPHWAVIDL